MLIPAPRSVMVGPSLKIGSSFQFDYSVNEFHPQIEAFRADFGLAGSPRGQVVKLWRDTNLAEEEYRLRFGSSISLSAATPTGLAWGLATLGQLIGHEVEARLIDDRPEVPFRCVTLDVARRFHSISTLRTIVRWCQAGKVRYLQLHLTDDQNWMFPTSALKGVDSRNGSGHKAYTLSELTGLQTFASARGVTVIPEIDMPGHSTLAAQVDPELFLIKGSQSTNCLNFASPHVRRVLKQLIGEVASAFPRSPYIHIGGDEAWYPNAEQNTDFKMAIAELSPKATPEDVFVDFVGEMTDEVIKLGRTPLVWEGFTSSPFARRRISKRTAIVAWEGTYYPARQLIPDGFNVINAGWDPNYVVNHYPYDVYTLVPLEHLYRSSYRHFSIVDRGTSPLPDFEWQDAKHVLGSMLCWWEGREWNAQQVLPPRILAFGARLWNPAGEHDYRDFLARIHAISGRILSQSFPFDLVINGTRAGYPEQFTEAVQARAVGRIQGLKFAYRTDGEPPSVADLTTSRSIDVSKSCVVSIQAFLGETAIGDARFVRLHKVTVVPNLAMGCRVTTSAEDDPQFPVQCVTSGAADQLDAFWLAYPNPQFLTIDLGSIKSLTRIEVVACWAAGSPTHYRLALSTDGRDYATIIDASHQETPTTRDGFVHRFKPTPARFIRLETLGGGLYPSSMSRINQIRAFDDGINP